MFAMLQCDRSLDDCMVVIIIRTIQPAKYCFRSEAGSTLGGGSRTQKLQQTTLPPELTTALEHMSGQLDIITQVCPIHGCTSSLFIRTSCIHCVSNHYASIQMQNIFFDNALISSSVILYFESCQTFLLTMTIIYNLRVLRHLYAKNHFWVSHSIMQVSLQL